MYVVKSRCYGVFQRATQGQTGGDGSRESAPGAMSGAGLDSWMAEPTCARRCSEDVGDLNRREMTAFDECGRRAEA